MTEQWEVTWQHVDKHENPRLMPPGWEPIGGTDEGVWLRRRVPEASQSPRPARVLTATEITARQRELLRRQREDVTR